MLVEVLYFFKFTFLFEYSNKCTVNLLLFCTMTNNCTIISQIITLLHFFISVINQLDAQNFCFTISLFHASTCFEDMCSKHVEV